MKKLLLIVALASGAGNLFGINPETSSIGDDYRHERKKSDAAYAKQLQGEENSAQVAHDAEFARKLDAKERGVPYDHTTSFSIPSSALSSAIR